MIKNDIDFLNQMIAHHTSAVEMSKKYLASTNGQSYANVVRLAQSVVTNQNTEIEKMKKWLSTEDAPVDKPSKKPMAM